MRESEYLSQLEEKDEEKYSEIVDLIETGRFENAEKELDNFFENNPNFVPALNKLAVIYLYRENYNRADKILKNILDLDREFAPALTNLGSLAREREELERAKKLYKKAIEINEDYGPAYNNLGVIYREEGNYTESVKYLKKARKKGSMTYNVNLNKPFYKDPGCLFVLFLAAVLIFVIFLVFT
ncbi:MAG: tetratricopeptide repeat protein [Halanaerobium sp.]